MKCRNCKYMEPAPEGNGLYVCANEQSDNFGAYTGLCCEDDREDGEEE